MKLNMEPLEFARLMFEAKTKLLRADHGHGPDEHCANCDYHEKCGHINEFLVPWEDLPADARSKLLSLAQEILWRLEERG